MEKKSDKMKKWSMRIGIFLILLLTGIIVFSPYGSHGGFPYKLVRHTVEIDAPVDSVFKFLSNSKSASQWSVFVNHITTLNADSFPDGTVGSRRRCFCKKDGTGVQWDEKITELSPGKKRQLIIYNMKGFYMTAEHLATEQIYEKISDKKCRLTLTVFFKDAEPTLFEQMKTYLAAYKINSIFTGNMSNIKRIVEKKNNG
ncbi:MAG TPA: SRPBCC family protein [Bacteroidia bacterium]|nr:SRPBCC family protein [Bacteroidia bacterium]